MEGNILHRLLRQMPFVFKKYLRLQTETKPPEDVEFDTARKRWCSIILFFTTAKDVCRFAAVCTAWRSAAISDMVWERMITLHYGGQNIWEAVSPLAFSSKKQLYFCLVTDHATKSIWVDGSSGKIGCMISARDLSIAWGDNNSYWKWVRRDDSRLVWISLSNLHKIVSTAHSLFSINDDVVRIFPDSDLVWWQRFKCTILSPNTHYAVSFVVKMDDNRAESRYNSHRYGSPFIFSVTAPNGERMESARFLGDLERSVETHGAGLSMTPLGHDEDGWMEFVAGEFFLQEEPGSAEIEFSMKNIDCSFTKSGIWLDGVKIQPKH